MICQYNRHVQTVKWCIAAAFITVATSALAAEGIAGAPKGPQGKGTDPTIIGEEIAVLTQAPFVPPPIKRSHATKVVIKLEVREVVRKLADGAEYLFWTFGGEVPGSFMRIREGDLVEFHLNNHPTSKLPHNIDLHAVTGPGGGAASSFTAPGTRGQFAHSNVITVLNPGGEIVHQQVGLNQPIEPTLAVISAETCNPKSL